MTPENTNINGSTKPPEIQALEKACDSCHNGRVTFEIKPNGEKIVTLNGQVVHSTNPGEETSVKP